MSFRGTFAGVAPSGRIVMPGATTGWLMLAQALADWPILESTWEGEPPTDIDLKFFKLYGRPPRNNAEYFQGQCSSLKGPDTHSDSSEDWVHSHREGCDPDEDLACSTGYHDRFPCSAQRPDGINHHGLIHGQECRTPPRTNRHGEESRTPPTTNHGSTNHACPTPPERKLPLEPTSRIPTSRMTTTMTPTKIYPNPASMTMRTIRTPQGVRQLHRPATMLFVNQNRCGSHIIWNNTNMKWRLSTNSDTWVRSE